MTHEACRCRVTIILKEVRAIEKGHGGGGVDGRIHIFNYLRKYLRPHQPVFQDSREYLGNASTSRTGHYTLPHHDQWYEVIMENE